MEHLEDEISIRREVLALHPVGHPDRSESLNYLGTVLFTRFQQSGRMEDLEETNTLHHEALTLRPIGHPDRSQSLDNLASTLSTRFHQLGGLRTWKGQAPMKHSLSVLLVIQSAPHVSTTSPMFCLLAFTDWAEWRT